MKVLLQIIISILLAGHALALDFPPSFKISRLDAGKSLPDISLPNLDGSLMDFNTLKGRIVLVNFWATWCGPCKEEMPSLERLREKFPSDQLQILAVTNDIRPHEIQAFWKQLDLHFPVLLDKHEELFQALMIRNLPATLLVDIQGKIQGRVMGPREWDSPEAVAVVKSLFLNP